ncbi:MAG: beta-lactamase family protein [Bacteroidia bacterium]
MKALNSFFLLCCVIFFLSSSCANKSNKTGDNKPKTDCIGAEVDDQKYNLENEIVGQVKFIEEPDDFGTIETEMLEYKIPALSIAVINRGKIDWSKIYQNPEMNKDQELDCETIFQAASLSKPVTFLAALQMHEAGKLSLDSNIEHYLKEYELPAGKQTTENPVTFRNLFSHTSGISAGGYQGYEKGVNMPTDVEILSGNEASNTPAIEVIGTPNEMLAYSGGGYTLAELALQDIFDSEFSKIMKEWILEPAGMDYSEFTQPLPEERWHKVAKAHDVNGEPIKGDWRNHPEQAAAGLWSNASDMAKFLIEIFNAYQGKESIFTPSAIKAMINHERNGHIYGFIVNRVDDDLMITHYGGNMGYRTGMTISLTSGYGLVYLINSDNGGSLGNELMLSASRVYNWKQFRQTTALRAQVEVDQLRELVGEYKWNNQVDLSIGFDESEKILSLFFPNGDEYELTPVDGDDLDFIHSNTGIGVSFSSEDEYHSFLLYGQSAIKMEAD